MKVLCFELMEASGGRASASTLADLAASANELVVELTRRVHQVQRRAIKRSLMTQAAISLLTPSWCSPHWIWLNMLPSAASLPESKHSDTQVVFSLAGFNET